MLIPFGVFSAAGAGGGAAAGAYELISTAYGTGSSGTITFSSIDQSYKHLQIRAVARNTSSTANDARSLYLRFNGDTAGNYILHYLRGNGSTASSGTFGTGGTSIEIVQTVTSNGSPSGASGASVIDIMDYTSTAKNKTIRALGGVHTSGTNNVILNSGLWLNTSAVSSITLFDPSFSFTTISRFSLYGIRG